MELKGFYKKNSLKEGDIISLEYNKQKVKGVIIPSNTNTLMLKLDTGYNAGFEISKVENVKKEGESKGVGKAKTISIKKTFMV